MQMSTFRDMHLPLLRTLHARRAAWRTAQRSVLERMLVACACTIPGKLGLIKRY